jgi:hypothetical protein
MAIYPVAPGHPNYGSDGASKFIPEIWSTKLIVKFYKTTVFAAISNTDYEGEITAHGDKVVIRQVPDTTISEYNKGQNLSYESPESTVVELLIDKGRYFAFSCDDVDKKQADIAFVDNWSNDAAKQMQINIDRHILANVYSAAAAANIGTTAGKYSAFNMGTTGSAVQVTKANVIDYIVDAGTILSEQDVPEDGRWMVLPTWMTNLLKKSDIKDASLTGDSTSPLRNGLIGSIDGFKLYTTNNYTSVSDTNTCYNVIYGTNHAITFASQMTKMETLRNPNTFGDLIRGLNVFGYKVIKPEAMGVLYCYK